MTEEEQKVSGYPTDSDSMKEGVTPIEIILGFDPFLTFDEFESVTLPPGTVTNGKGNE